MSTPVLTEVDQRRTLSAKKRSKKVTVRNILATPFASYWPLLNLQDAAALSEVLRQHLVILKPRKVQIPWSEIKRIPRENRKEFRLNYTKNEADLKDLDKTYRSDIVFGINEVTKLLETKQASAVLLSHAVDPRFMVKHVIDMAVLKNTPILVVPNLNDLLKEVVGINSMIVAFRTVSDRLSKYSAIELKIKQLCPDYPIPQNHINYHRCESGYNSDNSDSTEVKNAVFPMEVHDDEEPKESDLPRNLYLYRKSKSERAFIPQLSRKQETKATADMEMDSNDFLSFGNSVSAASVNTNNNRLEGKKSKGKVSYKSLLLKRVTNNKDRDRKKIEMLKRKR